VPVTPENALQVSALYGCCRLIVDSLAAAPIRVYEVKANGQRELLHNDPVSRVLNYGARIDFHPDAPTAQAIEEGLFWPALTNDGNGYAEIQRDRAGNPIALWPIEPGRVTPKRDESGYFYEVQQPEGGVARVDPMDMFHLRGPSLYGWVGDATLYRAAKAVGIAQASQVFAAAYFANGTVMAGILKTDKPLTQEQKKNFGEGWRSNFSGAGKQYGTPILDQGLDYTPINHDAQKSQLVESRRFQVAEIARFFGVPTTLLADNEAWTNLSELYLGFYRNALLPWAERFDAEATRKLFPQRAPWREVAHDLTRLVMGSFKDQVASLDQAVAGGLKTRNEARAILGDNSIGDDGDVLVVGSSIRRLEDALKPPPPPVVAPGAAPEEADEEEESEDDAPPPRRSADVARVAVALDRFERAMSARRRDIEKNAPEKAEANLADLRARIEPALIAECRAATCDNTPEMDMRVKTIADAVLAGEPPHLAAERLCT